MVKFVKSSILVTSALTLSLSLNLTSAHAEEDTSSEIIPEETIMGENPVTERKVDFNNLSVTELDGSVTLYNTLEEMQIDLTYSQTPKIPKRPLTEKPRFPGAEEDTVTTAALGETYIGTKYYDMKFMGNSQYTPNWAYASSYVLNAAEDDHFEATFTTPYGEITSGFSRSYGVQTTIPANKKKFSKLSGYADLKIKTWRVSKPNVSISYYKNKVTKLNTYVKVRYKK